MKFLPYLLKHLRKNWFRTTLTVLAMAGQAIRIWERWVSAQARVPDHLPALLPISELGHLVSIGTLLAFTIVSGGIWLLRVRRPDLERPVQDPLGPVRPSLNACR